MLQKLMKIVKVFRKPKTFIVTFIAVNIVAVMVVWSAKPDTHAEAKKSMGKQSLIFKDVSVRILRIVKSHLYALYFSDLRKKLEERERIKKNFFDYKQSNKEVHYYFPCIFIS